MKNARNILVVMVIVAAAALAPAVQGQYAAGTGRGLDNNLQVGSGGVNSQAVQPDFRARNEMITRNVAGLGYFHAGIPYRAPGDFQGSLPGDAIFRFRAQSASPALYLPGASSNLPAILGQPTVSIYRNFAPTTAGQVTTGDIPKAAMGSSITVRPEASFFSPIGGTQQSGLIPENVIGAVPQPNGQLLQVQASPLTGLRITSPAPISDWSTRDLAPTTPAQPGLPDLNLNLNLNAPLLKPNIEIPNLPAHSGQWLGLGVEARVRPQRLGGQAATLDQHLAEIQAAMFSPLGAATVKPGEDVYMDILTRAKRNREIAAGMPAQPLPGAIPPDQMVKPPDENQEPVVATPPMGFLAPTTDQLAKARAKRQQAVGLITDVAPIPQAAGREPVDEPGPGGAEATTPAPGGQQPPTTPGPTGSSMDQFIAGLRNNSPPLPSMAGRRNDAVNQLLRQAEMSIVAGKYFDAIHHYQDALDLQRNQPLARVGLIHAEIGAGMIYSAAADLHALLDDHPELIAVRYQANLLPAAARLQWVRQQLDTTIAASQDPQPALLLAYLGYQLNTPTLVEYGLDLAQARDPRDPLIDLLRGLWIRPTGQAAPTTRPAQP